MKIQSPAILAIGLVASLTSAFAGSFTPAVGAGMADRAQRLPPPIVDARRSDPVAVTVPAATSPHSPVVERLAADH